MCSGNILFTESNVVKISGFDTRVALEQEAMTGSKPAVFTSLMPWLAPEIFSGGAYSTQSDVYSFGIIMFELFSGGQTLYDLSKPVEVRQKF